MFGLFSALGSVGMLCLDSYNRNNLNSPANRRDKEMLNQPGGVADSSKYFHWCEDARRSGKIYEPDFLKLQKWVGMDMNRVGFDAALKRGEAWVKRGAPEEEYEMMRRKF